MYKFLSPILLAAVAVAGCATFEKHENTAKLATQYAVLKLAEQSADGKRVERMENVRRIAGDVKAIASNQSTTVSFLYAMVTAEVNKLNLSPADKLLAAALIDMVTQELIDRVGEGTLDANASLQVAEVMDWIIQATAMT